MIKIEGNCFCIETAHTGYYLRKRGSLVENLHYGKKIHVEEEALTEKIGSGYGTDVIYSPEMACSLLHLGLDFTPPGKGDYRQGALEVTLENGSEVCDFSFLSAKVQKGTVSPKGLPGALGGEETLILTYSSEAGVQVKLYYTVYPQCDVLTRRMEVVNHTAGSLTLRRCLSYQLDLPKRPWVLSTFTGAWARERHETQAEIHTGTTSFGSRTGLSSHFCNPFFMISEKTATEKAGEVYGFNLIYSGSHLGQVEAGPYSKMRVEAGIQPTGFSWTLQKGEAFDTPEGVLTFSSEGKNAVSRNMHDFVKNHIVRGKWAKKERPVLLNNWEATYFDFKEAKLLKLAKEAKKLGIEMFVLDDGWFGNRNDDTSSLGDYRVNDKKLPGGLKGLAKKINGLGLEFGLWMEPEMVSPDSELYRAHPDWAVQVPKSTPSLGRNQLVLDLCREEVQNYVIEQVNCVLQCAPIHYVKWDMNRTLSDGFSLALEEQGRFFHSWMLGLYRILETVTRENPEVLFEGCASGGNRFDLGILCYMPQIWTSDDTDAYERMKIQTGTSYGYPQSVMACHVSAAPNHQTLRTSSIDSRFDTAAFGILGYELDLTKISSAEKKVIASQITFYKEYRKLLQFGDFYRIASPFENGESCVWTIVSKDKKQALVMEGTGRLQPNSETLPLRLQGLQPDYKYRMRVRSEKLDIRCVGSLMNQVLPVKVNSEGIAVHLAADHYMLSCEEEMYTVYGDLLMDAGIRQKQKFAGTGYNENVRMMPDYAARIYTLKQVSEKM